MQNAGQKENTWRSLDRSEVVCSAILIALGVFIILESRTWEYMTRDGPGPGFFPYWIGVAIVALSGLYLASHAYDIVRGEPVHRTNWAGTRVVLAGWATFMIAVALIKPLGFITALVVLMLVFVRVIYRRSFAAALAVAFGSALSFWVLFVKLLNLRLPAGPLGF